MATNVNGEATASAGIDTAQLMLLTHEVSDFLYREAELLDDRRFADWLSLLTDDVQYAMPLRRNVKFGEQETRENTRPGAELCWFDEGFSTLSKRVEQLMTGEHWAEEPLSRVSHAISNIRIAAVELPELTVNSHFMVYRNRVADETEFLVGRRTDRLRRVDGAWKLCRRYILLDQNVLLAKNLTLFF